MNRQYATMRREARRLLILAAALFACSGAHAETVRIARQFGLSYLPLILMQDGGLIEMEAKARGIDLDVQWLIFTGGPPINDALISGNIDMASGGVGPMLTIWSRTRATLRVKGIAALGSMPMWLMTTNPAVRNLADLTEKDRIALPGVKVSIQAVVLQMAAEKAFGAGNQYRLDPLTVSMGHPDGMTAMLGGGSEVTAHFTSAPYMYDEAATGRAHRVLSSYDVLGGPHTFNVVWATTRYYQGHPQVVAAFMAALDRAMGMIVEHPDQAAETWVRVEKARLSVADAAAMIRQKDNEWTTTPRRVMDFCNFMQATGAIKERAENWHQIFFPSAHGPDGG